MTSDNLTPLSSFSREFTGEVQSVTHEFSNGLDPDKIKATVLVDDEPVLVEALFGVITESRTANDAVTIKPFLRATARVDWNGGFKTHIEDLPDKIEQTMNDYIIDNTASLVQEQFYYGGVYNHESDEIEFPDKPGVTAEKR